MLSKIFANKLPLFDFINSFFDYINYGYQMIDRKVNVLKLNNDNWVINYDDKDSVCLNICGIYQIIINDITFEKVV